MLVIATISIVNSNNVDRNEESHHIMNFFFDNHPFLYTLKMFSGHLQPLLVNINYFCIYEEF